MRRKGNLHGENDKRNPNHRDCDPSDLVHPSRVFYDVDDDIARLLRHRARHISDRYDGQLVFAKVRHNHVRRFKIDVAV